MNKTITLAVFLAATLFLGACSSSTPVGNTNPFPTSIKVDINSLPEIKNETASGMVNWIPTPSPSSKVDYSGLFINYDNGVRIYFDNGIYISSGGHTDAIGSPDPDAQKYLEQPIPFEVKGLTGVPNTQFNNKTCAYRAWAVRKNDKERTAYFSYYKLQGSALSRIGMIIFNEVGNKETIVSADGINCDGKPVEDFINNPY